MSNAITVELTWDEVKDACVVGIERYVESKKAGSANHKKNTSLGDADIMMMGAIGELAVAKGLNITWHRPVNNFHFGGDVGIYQVRCASRPESGLRFRERDQDGYYIMVSGDALRTRDLRYIIHGWLSLKEALAVRENQGFTGKEFYMPPRTLHPIHDLPQLSHYQQSLDSLKEMPSNADLRF